MLTEPHIKERLSMAFVDAIAGRVGVNVSRELHDYGVDGTFQSVVETPFGFAGSGFTVQFQLKATVKWAEEDSQIVYDLEAKAYSNMLSRHRSAVPLVLILMCLPRDDRLWLTHNERALVLESCCYWLWLPSGTVPANRSTVRVRLPKGNLFNTVALEGILLRARAYAMGERDDV